MIPKQLGPWKISGELGRGEFSSVYACARDDNTGEDPNVKWAMKASPFAAPPTKGKERQDQKACRLVGWENQIYSLHAKGHPIFPKRPFRNSYATEQNGWRYLVIERIEGGTLKDRLIKAGGKLSTTSVYSVGARLVAGLKHLHDRQYVFRDLKPENVMTFNASDDPEGRGICLVDFGACEKYTDIRGAQSSANAAPNGTPLFMGVHAMESAPLGRRDDLQSLGYLLIWMLNGGVLPWSGAKSEQEIIAMKKDRKQIDNVCARWPGLQEYMDAVLDLELGDETPQMYKLLIDILVSGGGTLSGPIDWEARSKVDQKTIKDIKKTDRKGTATKRAVVDLSQDDDVEEESTIKVDDSDSKTKKTRSSRGIKVNDDEEEEATSSKSRRRIKHQEVNGQHSPKRSSRDASTTEKDMTWTTLRRTQPSRAAKTKAQSESASLSPTRNSRSVSPTRSPRAKTQTPSQSSVSAVKGKEAPTAVSTPRPRRKARRIFVEMVTLVSLVALLYPAMTRG